jgi:hypothetical protein
MGAGAFGRKRLSPFKGVLTISGSFSERFHQSTLDRRNMLLIL